MEIRPASYGCYEAMGTSKFQRKREKPKVCARSAGMDDSGANFEVGILRYDDVN
jgi:hypothetical protein